MKSFLLLLAVLPAVAVAVNSFKYTAFRGFAGQKVDGVKSSKLEMTVTLNSKTLINEIYQEVQLSSALGADHRV